MVDVARGGEHDVGTDVRRPVEARDRPPADPRDHVGVADHRPADRMRPEHRLGGEVVDEVLRVVLDHRDLLEDHLALAVQVGERRPEDHVHHRVERRLEVVVRDPRVDDGRVPRRRGVQLAAHRVEELRDLQRVVALRALEHEVLDEVRQARLRVRLVARTDPHPEPECDRPHALDALADDPLAPGERGDLVACHARRSYRRSPRVPATRIGHPVRREGGAPGADDRATSGRRRGRDRDRDRDRRAGAPRGARAAGRPSPARRSPRARPARRSRAWRRA